MVSVGKTHPFQHGSALLPCLLFTDFFMGSEILHKYTAYTAGRIHHCSAVLENHGNFSAPKGTPLFRTVTQKGFPIKHNVAFRHFASGRKKTHHRTDHRRLSAAALPHQRNDLTRFHIHGKIQHCWNIFICHCHMINF